MPLGIQTLPPTANADPDLIRRIAGGDLRIARTLATEGDVLTHRPVEDKGLRREQILDRVDEELLGARAVYPLSLQIDEPCGLQPAESSMHSRWGKPD